MHDSTDSTFSRRQLVGLVAAPAVAAAFAPMLAHSVMAAEDSPSKSNESPTKPAATDSKSAGTRTYNIRDYGAKGDGTTLDTAALQSAIDACHADQGGTVLVPAGDFLIGTTELKSNVTLHLSPKGRLLGSGKPEDYSAGKGVPPGNGNIVLLYAADAENVTIEGRGTIDGQGVNFYTGYGDGTGPGGPGGARAMSSVHICSCSLAAKICCCEMPSSPAAPTTAAAFCAANTCISTAFASTTA